MEITSMLSDNTDVPAPYRPQEPQAARGSAPKASKRKGNSAAPKAESRSKRPVAASRARLSELEAYTSTLSAFFAQGELTWQKEGILGDLRQMLRISEEHHQREMQRIWANPSLCALARAQNAGRDNSDRGRSVYDILPDPKSPSDTESEVEDAGAVLKKKKKKKKIALPKPIAPAAPYLAAEAPPAAASATSVAATPPPERPSTKLVLKKAAKKTPEVKKEPAEGAPLAAAASVPPAKQTPSVDEMARLQLEREKLQAELARLAADEDEEEEEDGQDDVSDTAAGGASEDDA